MITNTPSLERAIEGSQKVLYFTHDYFALAPDKSQMFEATAGMYSWTRIFLELTHKLGVKQTICVSPIELDHYSGTRNTPFELRQVCENKILYDAHFKLT